MRTTLTLLVALLPAAAMGYEAPIKASYIKDVPGGKLLFIMHLPGDPAEVKKTFAKPGLYRVDDTKNPLWTCDWVAEHERNVTLSRDGEWAVRVPDHDAGGRKWAEMSGARKNWTRPAGWENAPAAFVYHRGKLLRTFTVKELFDPPRFTDDDCFMGPEVTLDPMDDAGRVRLHAIHGSAVPQTATVDAATGDITARDSGLGVSDCGNTPPEKCGTPPPSRWNWMWVILIGSMVVGLGTAVVAVLAVILVRRR